MQFRTLGHSELEVSRICLGSMMWGSQNSESEAHRQLDYAMDRGINFIDTAELYAIPPNPETQGATEAILGRWLASYPDRDRLIIASKVTGRSQSTWIRGGETRLDRVQIEAAIDASLKRLRTDYVDLYQLHWPDRPVPLFGTEGRSYRDRSGRDDAPDDEVPLEETLSVLADLVRAGKVRHIGLSNETPWGLSRCLRAAEQHGLPRVVSVQNAYNLLNRMYEYGLAEFHRREGVGLLAYSPLGQGQLTGKYLDGACPPGTRKVLYQRFSRYETSRADDATRAYIELARRHQLDPVQMALAFVNSRSFVTSTIIGASTMAQLKDDIDSIDIQLSDEVLAGIDAIHEQSPDPCP